MTENQIEELKDVRNSKSGNTTRSGETDLNIRTDASQPTVQTIAVVN